MLLCLTSFEDTVFLSYTLNFLLRQWGNKTPSKSKDSQALEKTS